MSEFTFNDGGTLVQYLLADTLNKLGQNVRIYPNSGVEKPNSVFMNYYKNEFANV